MVLLTFTEDSMAKIIAGKKVTTIRYNAEYWALMWEHNHRTLHVWQPSPRTRHGKFQGTTKMLSFKICFGKLITGIDAERDGFETLEELICELGRLHKLDHEDVVMHGWGIIEFEPYGKWVRD